MDKIKLLELDEEISKFSIFDDYFPMYKIKGLTIEELDFLIKNGNQANKRIYMTEKSYLDSSHVKLLRVKRIQLSIQERLDKHKLEGFNPNCENKSCYLPILIALYDIDTILDFLSLEELNLLVELSDGFMKEVAIFIKQIREEKLKNNGNTTFGQK